MAERAPRRRSVKDRVVELRRVRAGDLIEHPSNWRVHPLAQRRALRGLLAEVGYADALIARADEDGSLVLIDGHLRKSLDEDQVLPVLVLDVSAAEADKLLVTLDPLAGMARADPDRLARLLEGVSSASAAVRELLAGLAREAGLPVLRGLIDPDEVPAPAVPRVGPGEVWSLGSHRLVCGDSTDPSVIRRVLGAERASLLFADPPYGVGYEGRTSGRLRIANDALGEAGTRALVRDALQAARPGLKPGAVFYVCSPSGDQELAFRLGLADAGLRLRQVIAWVKDAFVLGRMDFHWRHECILYGWVPGARHAFHGGRGEDTVWEHPRPRRSTEHPTMKPVTLVERAVRLSSSPGELVLDPFVGSGTTIVACERAGRRCAAIELDPAYCDVAITRWEAFTGRSAVREEDR